MSPRVSVVMPCFNAAPFVEQAVRSALEQTEPSVELIVVDDGSTDGSADVLTRLRAEFAERLVVLKTQRAGPYPARNLGLTKARGEFVAFLDADDWWEPDFLSTMCAAAEAGHGDVAYCGWRNVGVGRENNPPYVPPDYLAGDPVEAFLRDCPWPIHAALVRRSVLQQAGGFSVRMFSSMDYDLWIRLLALTRRMVHVPRVMAYYRWHGSGQISAVKWRQVLHAWQVRRDFCAANPELVRHLAPATRRRLVDGGLIEHGKALFWRRDLEGAQPLLRRALRTGAFGLGDLPMLGAALLPAGAFRRLVGLVDRRHG